VPRAAFSPRELAELTIAFYRRNYIEGLFLSSGVLRSPDYTMELMIKSLELIRYEHNFWGYIHAKTIPGASPDLIHKLGLLADRLSVNIELPIEDSLRRLAPSKTRTSILAPMTHISNQLKVNKRELIIYKNAPKFAAGGQATQMIIGATPESDYRIINLASGLYKKFGLKRVFYSAYIPTVEDTLLPSVDTKPPLLREHRLYQADFLMRMYNFEAGEILCERYPNFNPYLDPKCNWALNNMDFFPIDVNRATLDELLRVPGIGPTSARRIVTARRTGKLATADLKRIGVVLKRAQYFIITADKPFGSKTSREATARILIDPSVFSFGVEQMSLFDSPSSGSTALPGAGDIPNITDAVEEAVLCLTAKI
jgi:putative DNA modification/repair radical SAM protein